MFRSGFRNSMQYSTAFRSRCAFTVTRNLNLHNRKSLSSTNPPIKSSDSEKQSNAPQQPPRDSVKTVNTVGQLKEKVSNIAIVGVGTFASTGILAVAHYGIFDEHSWTLIMGSFGSSAMLLYVDPESRFARPRSIVLGHTISAACGVVVNKFVAVPMDSMLLAVPLACSGAAITMMLTNNLHPPAGGTALMTCTATGGMHEMGFEVLVPTLFGSSMLVLSAISMHRLLDEPNQNRYPAPWE